MTPGHQLKGGTTPYPVILVTCNETSIRIDKSTTSLLFVTANSCYTKRIDFWIIFG